MSRPRLPGIHEWLDRYVYVRTARAKSCGGTPYAPVMSERLREQGREHPTARGTRHHHALRAAYESNTSVEGWGALMPCVERMRAEGIVPVKWEAPVCNTSLGFDTRADALALLTRDCTNFVFEFKSMRTRAVINRDAGILLPPPLAELFRSARATYLMCAHVQVLYTLLAMNSKEWTRGGVLVFVVGEAFRPVYSETPRMTPELATRLALDFNLRHARLPRVPSRAAGVCRSCGRVACSVHRGHR